MFKKLKIINLNLKTINLYQKCFERNGTLKDTNLIIWQFFDKNVQNHVKMLYDDSRKLTASIYATHTVEFKINNKVVLGSQSLDTITDLNYRGKGLFVNLANVVYENLKNSNIKLVYGFPNGNSIHGFHKKLQWQVLDPVPFLIKPLKIGYFTKRIKFLNKLPNINIPYFARKKNQSNLIIWEQNYFPDDVNIIWDKFSKNINVSVHRDVNYLNWRYLRKPNSNYTILHCKDKQGKYLGYVVYKVIDKHGGRIGYIMELISDTDNIEAGQMLLQEAIRGIKKDQGDLILTWSMDHSPNYKLFKKEFFMKIPDKLKPIELHFGVRAFDKNIEEVLYDRKNWFISYSDSDTV